jgi:Na+/melibiose symporter-like transporter
MVRRHSRSSAILVACNTVAAGWMLIVVFLILFAVGAAGGSSGTLAWSAGVALFGVIGAGATYLFFALTLRCENCGERLFLERNKAKHSTAKKIKGLDYWASAVIGVLRCRQLTCMYCGERYLLGDGEDPKKAPKS